MRRTARFTVFAFAAIFACQFLSPLPAVANEDFVESPIIKKLVPEYYDYCRFFGIKPPKCLQISGVELAGIYKYFSNLRTELEREKKLLSARPGARERFATLALASKKKKHSLPGGVCRWREKGKILLIDREVLWKYESVVIKGTMEILEVYKIQNLSLDCHDKDFRKKHEFINDLIVDAVDLITLIDEFSRVRLQ